MSLLSKWLGKAGVPQAALDSMQGMIDGLTGEARKRVQEITGTLRSELAKLLPPPQTLAESVRGQAAFKKAYRSLSPEQQKGVDAILTTIIDCVLVKVRKALGL